jgi:hypothetical protein
MGLASLKGPTTHIAVVILIVNLSVAVIAPHGVLESIVSKLYFQKATEFILRHTDEHTVVISSYWDKVIYPQRITYGHVDQLKQPDFEALLKSISSAGFQTAYVDHKRNNKTVNHLLDAPYRAKHIQGPPLESGFFRTIRKFIPSELYPVNMYLISEADSSQSFKRGKDAAKVHYGVTQ